MSNAAATSDTLAKLVSALKAQAHTMGFADCAVTGVDLTEDADYLQKWLAAGHQGSMQWMAAHGDKRSHPASLVEGTLRVISLRMDYAQDVDSADAVLANPNKAYISRYALGRDYHKLIRKRLQQLALWLREQAALLGARSDNHRVFVDSAPVLEKALARNAGLGWIGKHTLVLNRHAGSWFFLGEIFTDLPLPVDPPQPSEHCGSCRSCIDICPTQAIIAPYQLDARRCISYLTIEHKGSIDPELRPLIGNRIFGCDDCQLVCPWNKFAQISTEADFSSRHNLHDTELLELFAWNETEFLTRTEGMALRRTGYVGWLRNLAVALGNLSAKDTVNPSSDNHQRTAILTALHQRLDYPDPVVQEHVQWAIGQYES